MSGRNSYASELVTILHPLVVLLEQNPTQLPNGDGQFSYKRRGDGWDFYSDSLKFVTFKKGELHKSFVRHISSTDISKLRKYVRVSLEEAC